MGPPRNRRRRPPLRVVLLTAVTGGVAALAAEPAGAVAGDWARNPQSQVRLISGDLMAARLGELRLGLQFRLAPGWHVYWKNSGDAGFAPILTLAAPGLSGSRLLWPAPRRFELPGGLEAFGYADEVVYPVRATLAAAGSGPLRLTADIDYLTCAVDCVPYRYALTLLLPLGERARPDPALAPLLALWWGALPLPVERLAGVASSGRFDTSRPDAPTLDISVQGLRPAAGAGPPDIFLEPTDELSTGRPTASATAGGIVFHIPLQPKVVGRPLPSQTTFAWTVTGLALAGARVAVESRTTVTFAAGARGRAGGTAGGGAGGRAIGGTSGGASHGDAAFTAFGPGPVTSALLAVLALTAALFSWGLLGDRRDAGAPLPAALGFAALAAALVPLYLLALQIQPEGLAGIELLLLAMALLVWLRWQCGGRRRLKFVLTMAVVVSAAGLLWVADHSRLAPTPTRGEPHALRPNR